MLLNSLFLIIGGVSLFLYGVHLLSSALEKASGGSFRHFLEKLTHHPLLGVLLGASITAVIQSSSAVSVMVVSFVNAGLLTLKQAISIMLGSHIGTTMTAWIVASVASFNIFDYVLPLIGIGFALMFFTKSKRPKLIGEIIFGFGLMFLGLELMKDAGNPLKGNTQVVELLSTLGNYPLLGVVAGIIFTVLVQSSSASIAMAQTMAWNGLINFDFSLGFILGANVGTTITAQIGAIGTNLNARRTALANSLISLFGSLYFIIFLQNGLYRSATEFLVPGTLETSNIMIHIAVAHTLFNLINSFVFLPLIQPLSLICEHLIKTENDNLKRNALYLNPKLLSTPNLAIEQVKMELLRLTKIGHKTFQEAFLLYLDNHTLDSASLQKEIKKIQKKEDSIDQLQGEVTAYIIDVQQRVLMESESQQIPCLIHTINDLEKIGDYSSDIAELTLKKEKNHVHHHPETYQELKKIYQAMNNLFLWIEESVSSGRKKLIEKSYTSIKKIHLINEEFRHNYLTSHKSISSKQYNIAILLELLFALEKITGHLKNIAQTVEHDYVWELRKN